MTDQKIEEQIFLHSRFNPEKAEQHGFQKDRDGYQRTIPFLNDAFRAELHVNQNGILSGEVIENAFNEPFLPLRVAQETGSFVSGVREAYEAVLKQVREECFDEVRFRTDQAVRLAAYLHQKYSEEPDYPFKDDQTMAVFRTGGKWYALIMCVPYEKLEPGREGIAEIVNLRQDTKRTEAGIYPAWHMNHQLWISAVLDGPISDQMLFEMAEESRGLIRKKWKI
ncbi:MAG: MmcQ/YjbR family DNA-binding protein [Lachnospiraceae bacterium]|nr:MmcQ/YjbR family DNA-binding protein [Lachnospiraceae bacterium]